MDSVYYGALVVLGIWRGRYKKFPQCGPLRELSSYSPFVFFISVILDKKFGIPPMSVSFRFGQRQICHVEERQCARARLSMAKGEPVVLRKWNLEI